MLHGISSVMKYFDSYTLVLFAKKTVGSASGSFRLYLTKPIMILATPMDHIPLKS